ncbi:transcriptional regulator [Shewanella sp. M16]|uniref:Mor transcription activator family protein n=1 Tax=Shewanella sp. M16 TaxID=2830837 RepID=UPI001BB07C08|nr:Mor transcription activator family protein [Shewanella sp. M16]MBS0044526.1 transcriptional regulator [Shewanella sp. M16]QYW06259.1 middle operon regulator [Shewanella phage vB_SspM_MuM16-2]
MTQSTNRTHSAANEENCDWVGFDSLSLDDIDRMADDDESYRWPETMRDIYDLFKCELTKQDIDPKIAIPLLHRLCREFGGLQMYLPRGHLLEIEMMNLSIWHEFNGKNVEDLARKYNKSMQHIYRVIAKMRKREMKTRQPDLF